MVSADRQTIMEANRSLRNIKTELETLLEKGVIDETVYDNIHAALPEESPLSGPLRRATSSNATPVQSNTASPAPTKAFANLDINSKSPAPPSYDDTPPPSLPSRKTNTKPIVAHARALYKYQGSDDRDVSFEKDDKISVFEYMNQDWWMGQNHRTGKEGIFPRNYVFVEREEKAPVQPLYGYPTQQAQSSNGPPQQRNPYHADNPEVAISEDGGSSSHDTSKYQQHGKKFGKKLGNAAIFGAGATIGGKIVNGIF
jgi:hypothetical protein